MQQDVLFWFSVVCVIVSIVSFGLSLYLPRTRRFDVDKERRQLEARLQRRSERPQHWERVGHDVALFKIGQLFRYPREALTDAWARAEMFVARKRDAQWVEPSGVHRKELSDTDPDLTRPVDPDDVEPDADTWPNGSIPAPADSDRVLKQIDNIQHGFELYRKTSGK